MWKKAEWNKEFSCIFFFYLLRRKMSRCFLLKMQLIMAESKMKANRSACPMSQPPRSSPVEETIYVNPFFFFFYLIVCSAQTNEKKSYEEHCSMIHDVIVNRFEILRNIRFGSNLLSYNRIKFLFPWSAISYRIGEKLGNVIRESRFHKRNKTQ